MSFDSVFNGDPTTPNVSASGDASFGIDLNSGQLYFRSPLGPIPGWQPIAGGGGGVTSIIAGSGISVDQSTGDVTVSAIGGGGSVSSVFSRSGDVVAEADDYSAVPNLHLGDGGNGEVLFNTSSGAIIVQDNAFSGIVTDGAGSLGIAAGLGQTLLGPGTVNIQTSALVQFSSPAVAIQTPGSPTSSSTAGVTGQIIWDTNNIYVCTQGGIAGSATWKAAALSSV
jgi:hypothetical protein